MDMALTGVCFFRDGFTRPPGWEERSRSTLSRVTKRGADRHAAASNFFTFPLERLLTSFYRYLFISVLRIISFHTCDLRYDL